MPQHIIFCLKMQKKTGIIQLLQKSIFGVISKVTILGHIFGSNILYMDSFQILFVSNIK